ncbi:hypothetical protein [Abyssicoccus albus]|uniref:hypothetical protein n=1 Tax=Abyssicoccus albus TaxID=1817405 RepID=UPI00097E348C|nr:hypothetical protein [Abyssicoccus albus]AQL56913.1 hypothetical protein BVH56_08295 [Abyssicoccus albus]
MVSRKLLINAMIVSAIFLVGCSSDGTGEFEEAIIDTPELKNDGIEYIARNRQNEKELAIYTVNGDVYVSDAGSIAWEKVLNEGQTR